MTANQPHKEGEGTSKQMLTFYSSTIVTHKLLDCNGTIVTHKLMERNCNPQIIGL